MKLPKQANNGTTYRQAAAPSHTARKGKRRATPGCSLPREGWQSAPFADEDGKRVDQLQIALATLAEKKPLLSEFCLQLLQDADAATQTVHASFNDAKKDLRKKRKRAQRAREPFLNIVKQIQEAERTATAPIEAELNTVMGELEKYLPSLDAIVSETDTKFSFDSNQPESALRILPKLLRKAKQAEDEARQHSLHEEAPEYDNPWYVWAGEFAMGIALGLFTGIELTLLSPEQVKYFDWTAFPMLLLFAVMGMGMIIALKAGFYRLWKWAAEAKRAGVAALITLFIGLVDISIVRAFRLSDPTILNPGDIVYWLSSCVFILPSAFAAASKGWMHGMKQKAMPVALVPESTSSEPVEAATPPALPVNPIAPPVPVQPDGSVEWVPAVVAYCKLLTEKQNRLVEEAARIAAPYRNLLGLYEAELNYATEFDDATRQRLETDRGDAVMNHEWAKAFVLRVALMFESVPDIQVNNYYKVNTKSVDTQKTPIFRGFWAKVRDRWIKFRNRRQKSQSS